VASVVCLKGQSQHYPGWTEENHKTSESE